jgi:hypothetical protein
VKPADWPSRLREHVQQRTIVLPEHRVLFFPMPKAGCTSTLWLLAGLLGLTPEDFSRSALAEVSPALLVHDLGRWPDGHRLAQLDDADRDRALHADGWFRFTIVRDPAPRLWSAWQSKLLLREPKFVAKFGDQPWFPRLPVDPQQVVEDFHAFVAVLGRDDTHDPHWAPQQHMAEALPLDHVGRVEAMADTLDALRAHLAPTRLDAPLRRDNRTPLPLPAAAYPAAAAAAVDDYYRADLDAFGYPPVASRPVTTDRWSDEVAPLLPVVRDLVDHNERIGQLSRLARDRGARARALAEKRHGKGDAQ